MTEITSPQSAPVAAEEEMIDVPHLPGGNMIAGQHHSFLYISSSFRDYRLDMASIATPESKIRKRDTVAVGTLQETLDQLAVDPERDWISQGQFLYLSEQERRHMLGEGRPNLFFLKKDDNRPAIQPGNLFILVAYFYTTAKAVCVYEAGFQGVWTKDKGIDVRFFSRHFVPPRL